MESWPLWRALFSASNSSSRSCAIHFWTARMRAHLFSNSLPCQRNFNKLQLSLRRHSVTRASLLSPRPLSSGWTIRMAGRQLEPPPSVHRLVSAHPPGHKDATRPRLCCLAVLEAADSGRCTSRAAPALLQIQFNYPYCSPFVPGASIVPLVTLDLCLSQSATTSVRPRVKVALATATLGRFIKRSRLCAAFEANLLGQLERVSCSSGPLRRWVCVCVLERLFVCLFACKSKCTCVDWSNFHCAPAFQVLEGGK